MVSRPRRFLSHGSQDGWGYFPAALQGSGIMAMICSCARVMPAPDACHMAAFPGPDGPAFWKQANLPNITRGNRLG